LEVIWFNTPAQAGPPIPVLGCELLCEMCGNRNIDGPGFNIVTAFQILLSVLCFITFHLGVTESQNHRMFGVGRDLCGSSSPTPLPKQGHLQQATEDLVQVSLEYLQRRTLHNLPGQPVPVLRHPQREEVLLHLQTECPMLHFVPVASCPVTRNH